MPDDTSSGLPGIIAATGSAVVAAVVSACAIWAKITDGRRERLSTASTDKAREDLDVHQRDYLDRVERRLRLTEDRSDLWEARARRSDRIAHELRNEINARRAAAGEKPMAALPLLEDPIEEPEP